jgi:hypothetical protein
MDALHVSRFRARYRVPAGDTAARARLDAVLRDVLDEALETALSRAGIDARDEICLREVTAPARLRLAEPDGALAAAWSTALADAIRATLHAGGDGVARFTGRGHALADLLVSVARASYRRAWAWRQLGLWSAGDTPSAEAAVDAAASALASNPREIVAALATAARAGALVPLAARIRPDAWRRIAGAALAAASVRDSTIAELLVTGDDGASISSPSPSQQPDDPRRPTQAGADDRGASPAVDPASAGIVHFVLYPALARLIGRVARTSSIYPAVVAAPAESRRPLAALALLEIEPAALARSSAPAAVAALVRDAAADAQVRESPADRPAEMVDREYRTKWTNADVSAGAENGTRRTDETPSSEQDYRTKWTNGDSAEEAFVGRDRSSPSGDTAVIDVDLPTSIESPERERRDGERADADLPSHAVDGAEERSGAGEMERNPSTESDVTPDAEDDVVEAERVTGETEWGGLLFLLNVVSELRLADEVADAPPFAERTLRWVLHRIAAALLGTDERDAAALAFAGLGPDRDPPTLGEPPASDLEAASVAELAARLARALHERLRGEPAPDARAANALVRQVARRHAAIVADPGWIDARMRLDEVDTAVRRAGLDLDPGWLPWLGCVVRFVYV